MKRESVAEFLSSELEKKITGLHFFKEVGRNNPQELQTLVEQSCLIYGRPGELLLEAGKQDNRLYFLMRGELQVRAPGTNRILGKLIGGELFGDISVITQSPRAAEIVVPESGRDVVVLALDFSLLAELENHSVFSLNTKRMVYRQIVHVLRWRSDLYKIKFPGNRLVEEPYQVKWRSSGGSEQEQLLALSEDALYLAKRLQNLNQKLGAVGHDAVGQALQRQVS